MRPVLLVAVAWWLLPPLLYSKEKASEARYVFVGDSITDGHTLPLLVRQALSEAGKPVPLVLNAGVAGDTAAGMRARLQRDVLSRKPTLVLFSAGINDVLRGVQPENYEKDVSRAAAKLAENKVPLVLLTTTVLGPKHEKADRKLSEFNAALARVAVKYHCKVAGVNALMKQERQKGAALLEPDQVHLTFAGYRVMARAVLDALGHKDVKVPGELKVELMPGVVREWKVKALQKPNALDDKTVQHLKPDASWKTLVLPQKEPRKHWWEDQERRRGFAFSLDKLAGPGKAHVGVATLQARTPRKVYLNTGAQLTAVWLNGKRVYKSEAWTGWHAGKERIRVELTRGENILVIETGPAFFLSLTDTDTESHADVLVP